MKAGEVNIHVIRPADLSREEAEVLLTPEERERAARFRFEKDAVHWMACRAAMRLILGESLGMPPLEVPLLVAEYGKPLLAAPHDGLHFNLSHCADLALLAITETGPVGIDLEQQARAAELLECETSFCHPQEIAALPVDAETRAAALLNIWTAKEAALKALGTGLSHPPESVQILNDAAVSDLPLKGMQSLTIHRLEGSGNPHSGKRPAPTGPLGERSLPVKNYCAALATMGEVSEIRFMVFDRSKSPGIGD